MATVLSNYENSHLPRVLPAPVKLEVLPGSPGLAPIHTGGAQRGDRRGLSLPATAGPGRPSNCSGTPISTPLSIGESLFLCLEKPASDPMDSMGLKGFRGTTRMLRRSEYTLEVLSVQLRGDRGSCLGSWGLCGVYGPGRAHAGPSPFQPLCGPSQAAFEDGEAGRRWGGRGGGAGGLAAVGHHRSGPAGGPPRVSSRSSRPWPRAASSPTGLV